MQCAYLPHICLSVAPLGHARSLRGGSWVSMLCRGAHGIASERHVRLASMSAAAGGGIRQQALGAAAAQASVQLTQLKTIAAATEAPVDICVQLRHEASHPCTVDML